MASTRSDTQSPTETTGDRPRIDLSVFAAVAAATAPIGVARFCRWFACFATAGREG